MKTFDNVAKLKLATLTTGQFVETGGYYTKGGGGAAKYLIVAPQAADGYGDHVLANGNVAVLQVDGEVDIRQFGAVADGADPSNPMMANPNPTDNKGAIDAAFDYLKRGTYPEFQGGVVRFIGGTNACYATSGEHDLPEAKIIGDNVKIRALNNPFAVFRLNLRHTTNTRRFTKNWYFGGFTAFSDRGFGVPTETTDFDHFLEILGGWLIRSKIEHIDCDPGLACRSVIRWDLTHQDLASGVTEVGVPDGVELHAISAQYTENTSYCISFDGDQLGSGSRIASLSFSDIYNSITNAYGYVTRSDPQTDFGTIRFRNTNAGRAEFDEIYGPTHLIRMFEDSKLSECQFESIYIEMVRALSPVFESVFRGSEAATIEDCQFPKITMYTENASLQASPRYFFGIDFVRCTFYDLKTITNSSGTNPTNSRSDKHRRKLYV